MMHKFNAICILGLSVIALNSCTLKLPAGDQGSQSSLLQQYRDAASSASANQQYALAENYYLLAIAEYERAGKKSSSTNGYLSHIYFEQGKYDAALNSENICYQRRSNEMQIHEVFWHYGYLAEIYQAQGKYDEARQAVQWLIDNADKQMKAAEQTKDNVDLINARSLKFWQAYPAISNYYIEVGDYDKAIRLLREHVDYCIQCKTIPQNRAKGKNRLALAYYYAGDETMADKLFREAGGLNANAFAGFPTDLSQSLLMLAKINTVHFSRVKMRE